jgi:hypothetical protein
MYIKVNSENSKQYPYSVLDLKQDNNQTSFPSQVSNSLLAEFGVYPVEATEYPDVGFDKNVNEGTPELVNGEWKQVWVVTDKPNDEVNQIHESLRAEAYRNESDPLFFKAQRGEIEQQVWLDKVAEIKARYPK